MAYVIVVGLLALVAAAVPVAAVLGILGFVLDFLATNGRLRAALSEIVWEKSTDFLFVAIPMFILLGEIILRAGIARKMYNAMVQWISWLPGGLMHANIGTSAVFSATSGSSVATAATVGTVAYPEIQVRKYSESLFLGSLAAGGTLGILIPPSISLILIGLLTNTSVPELYLAGIIPGIFLSLLFIAIVVVTCLVRPSMGGQPVETSWSRRLRSLPDLLAPIFLFFCVVGSIYSGIATPTEAASIGVVVALIIAAFSGSLNFQMMLGAFEGTMRTTAMIMLITFAAIFLNFVLGFVGLTTAIVEAINALGLTPVQTILFLVVFYLIIGMFMETLSMLLTTVPIVFPIVAALDVPEFSDVWFGILMTLLMEAALITPPIGMNLYVVQSIRSRGGNFKDVAVGSVPFVFVMLVMIGLLIAFPAIATWLPDQIYR